MKMAESQTMMAQARGDSDWEKGGVIGAGCGSQVLRLLAKNGAERERLFGTWLDLSARGVMMLPVRRNNWLLWVCALGFCLGCEESKSEPKPAVSEKAPKVEAAEPVAAKLKGPPELALDDISPRVGYSRIVIKEERDRANLRTELAEYKEFLSGKDVPLLVDRKASIRLVTYYLGELGELGVASVLIRTETRQEYPSELRFVPQKRAAQPTACTPVAMILEDRGTAVWKLSGGVASKRTHGLGGPDLSMTSETLERFLKGCKQDKRLYIAAPEGIGWGLLFDLAASAQTLTNLKPDATILLEQLPVPGHKVEL